MDTQLVATETSQRIQLKHLDLHGSFEATEDSKKSNMAKGTSMDQLNVSMMAESPSTTSRHPEYPPSGSSPRPTASRKSRPNTSAAPAISDSPASSVDLNLDDDDKAEIEAMSMLLALAATEGVVDDQVAGIQQRPVDVAEERIAAAQARVVDAEKNISTSTRSDDTEMIDALRRDQECQSLPDCPPPRYIEGMHGDLPEAKRRWASTLAWQKAYGINGILTEPNPQYVPIRKHFSHFFHGHGKSGSVVLYLRPGYSDFQQLWKTPFSGTSATPGSLNDINNLPTKKTSVSQASIKGASSKTEPKGQGPTERLVKPDDLVRHNVFMLESLFTHWGTAVECKVGEQNTAFKMQRLVAVFDLDRLNFKNLRQFFGVFKKVVQILEQHYVGRADRICVINAPNFRNIAMLVYPLIPREVKAKIKVCGRNYQEQLKDILVAEEMPKEYGGTSDVPMGQWPLEQLINAQCAHPQRQWPSMFSPASLYNPTDADRFGGVSPEGVMPDDEPGRLEKHHAEAFRRSLERRKLKQAELVAAQNELAAAIIEKDAACDIAAPVQANAKEGSNSDNAPSPITGRPPSSMPS
jgi:hypothetical protein